MFSGFLLALALPAMLVLATAATGLWILAYPGGEFLLTHLANMDVSVGKTHSVCFRCCLSSAHST